MTKEGITLSSASKARVTFFNTASVVLIPCKEEYFAAGIAKDLWLNPDESREIKENAFTEIREFIEQQRSLGINITLKEAIELHYQSQESLETETGLSLNY